MGLLPHTKVEFELAGDHVRIRKARRPPGESARARLALEVLRGTADTRMSTDEFLALTGAKPALPRDASDTAYPHLAGPHERLSWRPRGQQRPVGRRHERSELTGRGGRCGGAEAGAVDTGEIRARWPNANCVTKPVCWRQKRSTWDPF